jgi:predicted dinucleotide-binding enzyme
LERPVGRRVASETVSVLGGTGNLGFGLAVRLGVAGYSVCLGSRDPERALAAAALRDLDRPLGQDTLICGDRAAKEVVTDKTHAGIQVTSLGAYS